METSYATMLITIATAVIAACGFRRLSKFGVSVCHLTNGNVVHEKRVYHVAPSMALAMTTALAVIVGGCGGDKKAKAEHEPDTIAITDTTEEPEAVEMMDMTATIDEDTTVWEGDYKCMRGNPVCKSTDPDYFDEEKTRVHRHSLYFAGTVFKTTVTSDVIVKNHPSSNGEELFEISKGSKILGLGVSKDGWVYIATKEPTPRKGWVYGQYMKFKDGQKVAPISELKVDTSFFFAEQFAKKGGDSDFAYLTLSYKDGNTEQKVRVPAQKYGDFYTFAFSIYNENSHYGITPGIYVWYYAEDRIEHASFWVRERLEYDEDNYPLRHIPFVTSDFKYYVINNPYGKLFRSKDNVFIHSYMSDDYDFVRERFPYLLENMQNNTVLMHCPKDSLVAKVFGNNTKMDDEIKEYEEEFIINDGPLNEECGEFIRVMCEFNIETGNRKIVSAIRSCV